jgi:peptidoglycan hydrolase CwlO-like protein
MVGISVAVVLFGATMSGGVASADPIGTTKGQIGAVESEIEAGAAQVHQLTLAYEQANLDASTLGQQVSADQMEIAQLRSRVSGSENVLRKEALLSYTGDTGSDLGTPNDTTDPAVRAEYLQVAAGNINDAVDQYRTEQRQLSTAEVNLSHQQQASQAAAASAAGARQQALAQAAAEQGQLDQLQGQLSQFVEAAAIAAEQNAAAAATAAAAPTPAPAPTPTPTPPVRATPATPKTPPPPPVTAPPSTPGYTDAGGVWLQLRECESSDNYAENTGNGYYGAYQFSEQTWTDLGFPGRPDLESHQMQDQAAMELQARSGWGQWPACSAALGLR